MIMGHGKVAFVSLTSLKVKKFNRIWPTHFGIQMRMLDIRERATQIKWQTLAKYLTIVDLRRISSYILTSSMVLNMD